MHNVHSVCLAGLAEYLAGWLVNLASAWYGSDENVADTMRGERERQNKRRRRENEIFAASKSYLVVVGPGFTVHSPLRPH